MDLPIGLYDRMSTDEQSLDKSVNMLRDMAKRYNLKYRTYNDEDVSGKIKINKRPGGSQLIKDLENNKICGIIVTRWDRITRNLKHGIDFLEFWDKHEFKFLSIFDGEFTGTPDNKFTFKLKCLLAEKELDDLEWRRNIGIAQAKKEGKYKGGKKGRTWKCKN